MFVRGEDRAAHRPQGSRQASRPHRRLLAVRPRRRHPGRTGPSHRPRPARGPACRPVRSRGVPAWHLRTPHPRRALRRPRRLRHRPLPSPPRPHRRLRLRPPRLRQDQPHLLLAVPAHPHTGRTVLCLTILATQKTTGDSIPTSLRDNSGLAVAFALKTTESSVAALGDAIREYPGYSPTLLRETPNGIGPAVVTLTTGTDPFTRLRVPLITEQWAAARAAASACHRRDPYQVEADSAPSQLPVVPA